MTSRDRYFAAVIEAAPIAVMSALFLTPLVIFWLRVWGPLRPFDIAAVPAPSTLVLCAGVLACVLAARPPERYFRVQPFERDGRFYRAVGVRVFRKVVPNGDWMNRARRRRDRTFRLIASRADIASWLPRTKASETGHLVMMVLGILSAAYAAAVGWAAWAVALTLGNIITNVYPVFLQRYTRARLLHAARRGGDNDAQPSSRRDDYRMADQCPGDVVSRRAAAIVVVDRIGTEYSPTNVPRHRRTSSQLPCTMDADVGS